MQRPHRRRVIISVYGEQYLVYNECVKCEQWSIGDTSFYLCQFLISIESAKPPFTLFYKNEWYFVSSFLSVSVSLSFSLFRSLVFCFLQFFTKRLLLEMHELTRIAGNGSFNFSIQDEYILNKIFCKMLAKVWLTLKYSCRATFFANTISQMLVFCLFFFSFSFIVCRLSNNISIKDERSKVELRFCSAFLRTSYNFCINRWYELITRSLYCFLPARDTSPLQIYVLIFPFKLQY